MPRRKILPAGAVPRVCDKCGKHFRTLTDREWRNVQNMHALSLKHSPGLYAKPDAPRT